MDLFHGFVVRANTSHPADCINLSAMVWTGAGNAPKPGQNRLDCGKTWRRGRQLCLTPCSHPARNPEGSHSHRGPGRVRMEREDSLHAVPSGLCLPFPTERGTNSSRSKIPSVNPGAGREGNGELSNALGRSRREWLCLEHPKSLPNPCQTQGRSGAGQPLADPSRPAGSRILPGCRARELPQL